jgi:hypothetical protein
VSPLLLDPVGYGGPCALRLVGEIAALVRKSVQRCAATPFEVCLGAQRSILVAAPMNDTITFKSLSGSPAQMKDGLPPVTLGTAADPYAYRWRELRRRQARALCVAAACLVVSAIGVYWLPSTITKWGLIMLALAATTPFVVALRSYPCPRCKNSFFERSHEERLDFFAKQCLHCRLKVGTSKADAVPVVDEPKIRIIG